MTEGNEISKEFNSPALKLPGDFPTTIYFLHKKTTGGRVFSIPFVLLDGEHRKQ